MYRLVVIPPAVFPVLANSVHSLLWHKVLSFLCGNLLAFIGTSSCLASRPSSLDCSVYLHPMVLFRKLLFTPLRSSSWDAPRQARTTRKTTVYLRSPSWIPPAHPGVRSLWP